MATNSIVIGGNLTVMTASPTLLTMDQLDFRQRLVSTTKQVRALPGEHITLRTPPGFPTNCEVAIEVNTQQCEDFFRPKIIQVRNGELSVEHEGDQVLHLKKGAQPAQIRFTTHDKAAHGRTPPQLLPSPPQRLSTDQVLEMVQLYEANTISPSQVQHFKNTISNH